MKLSLMAETLIGSEIIKLAGEIKQKIAQGHEVFNFTIGDFDPQIFPIPTELETYIIQSYLEKNTNYPAGEGMLELRKEVAKFIKKFQGLDYPDSGILIGGGARPMIYSIYATVLDPGDSVIFPVPSWNNNHYCHLLRANPIMVETFPEDNFMPTAASIKPHISKAQLISLCSPLNPTGTVFTKQALTEICQLVLDENKRRGDNEKPLYLLYDQIYSVLTYGDIVHYDPVSLFPEMRPFTLFVDGISKSLAATGVRVGWTFGPDEVINKMKSILSHIGAWAPKAEQLATAQFLANEQLIENYLNKFKPEIIERLEGLHKGFQILKSEGHSIDSIKPQAAIYLTIQLALQGKTTVEGKKLETTPDVTDYILSEAGLAIVPFSAFGDSPSSTWYRLSVGTCKKSDVAKALNKLKLALEKLK